MTKEIMFTTPLSSEQGCVPRQISEGYGAKLTEPILSLFTAINGRLVRRMNLYGLSGVNLPKISPSAESSCLTRLNCVTQADQYGTADRKFKTQSCAYHRATSKARYR